MVIVEVNEWRNFIKIYVKMYDRNYRRDIIQGLTFYGCL
jgi:hypothetical protein